MAKTAIQAQNPETSGIFRAPWRERVRDEVAQSVIEDGVVRYTGLGPEYKPTSYRSGEAISHEQAEREYRESFHAVPSAHVGSAPGLWDHEEEMRMNPRSVARHLRKSGERYDLDRMRVYVEKNSTQLTAQENEVFVLFWVQGRSYGQIALYTGRQRESVFSAVKRLRKKLAEAGR